MKGVSRPLRIAIDTFALVPGKGKGAGFGTYVSNLVPCLARIASDHEIVVFGNPMNTCLFPPGVRVVRVPLPPERELWPFRILWQQVLLPAALEALKIDVVHHPMDFGPLLVRRPTVITLHDLIDFFYDREFEGHRASATMRYSMTMKRLTSRRADMVIAVSEATRDDAIRYLDVPPHRIVVIPEAPAMAAGADTGPHQLPAGVRKPYFFVVAATNAHKNILGMLKGYQLARRRYGLPHELVLCGLAGQDHTECMRAILRSPEIAHIKVLGFVGQDRLGALYAQADALLFVTLKEGFGLPILEALALGTPVITSNLRPMRDIAGPGGLLVPPGDEAAMALAMYRLATEKGLRRRLSRAGRRWASRFSWERTAKLTLAVYEEVARRRRLA